MTLAQWLRRLTLREDINFLLTNRVPRIALTRFIGWWSRIEQSWIRDLSIGLWRAFAALELDDTEQREFRSMHDCFTRRLRPGARPIDQDPAALASPCDALVGAHGQVADGLLFQAKGFPYQLADLVPDAVLAARLHDASYVTLRITSSMYHRFHAPADCVIRRVDYVSGDTWNVNPIALQRVERLFCRNERAVIRATLADDALLVMVPVAAILVASIRLHFIDTRLHLHYRGVNPIDCEAHVARGEELGWFEQGSTIILFAPPAYRLRRGLVTGARVRVGEALLRNDEKI